MHFILEKFEYYAEQLPLEIFVLIGSFLEEVIAPIPSPFVMGLAGSVAATQDRAFVYLAALSLIAALGKTLGAMLLYWLADKVEDVVLSKIGRFIGITHVEVERLGQRLNTGTWRDWAVLMLIRSTPVIASAPVSLACGFIKVPFRLFVITTFSGTIIRDFVYLYAGYTTFGAASSLTDGLSGLESVIQVFMAIAGLVLIALIIYRRKNNQKLVKTRPKRDRD